MADIGPLIGGVFGFSASLAPDVIELIKSSYAHKYAMEEKRLEIEAAELNYKFQIETSNIDASTKELEALLAADAALPGNAFINLLRAAVRPVVTYLFLLLFSIVKLTTLFSTVVYDHTPMIVAIPLLWDAESMSLFAAVLSFWFGARAMSQYRSTINMKTTATAVPRSLSKARKRKQ